MSSESEEKRPHSHSSSFSCILGKLTEIQKAAYDTVKSDISICQSTATDEANTLFFVVDTPDEDNFSALGDKLEDITGYPDWRIVRKQSETLAQFNRMYKYETPIDPEHPEKIHAFVAQTESGSKKIKL